MTKSTNNNINYYNKYINTYKAKALAYYHNHIDDIKQYKNIKNKCSICGGSYNNSHKSHHNKTLKHIKAVTKNTNDELIILHLKVIKILNTNLESLFADHMKLLEEIKSLKKLNIKYL